MHRPSPISLGRSLFSIEAGGFVLTETTHPPSLRLARHSHRRANVVCVLEGSFTEQVGTRAYRCEARTLLIKPAGATHSDAYDASGARSLIVELDPERLEGSDALEGTFREARRIGASTTSVVSRIRREFRRQDPLSALAIEALALEFLVDLGRLCGMRVPAGDPGRAEAAREYIHAHFRERIGLSNVAGACGVHRAHLARVFRERYQCSVGDYVRRLRVDRAARELVGTDEPISAIAASFGFYDQSHFTNAFRLYAGMTPAEYRRAARGDIPAPGAPGAGAESLSPVSDLS